MEKSINENTSGLIKRLFSKGANFKTLTKEEVDRVGEYMNHSHTKLKNRTVILKTLRKEGALSKKELAAEIKLTPAAITKLCNEMIVEDILIETGEKKQQRAGRREILIDINYKSKYIYSINIEKYNAYFVLVDLKGDTVFSFEEELTLAHSIETILEKSILKFKESIALLKVNEDKILGIGVSLPRIFMGDKFENNKERILRYLQKVTNYSVVVKNNVKALALGELLKGEYKGSFLFVKYGPGIGSTVVLDGDIPEDNGEYFGDIGHSLIKGWQEDKCSVCGKRGCFETNVSYDRVLGLSSKKSISEFLSSAVEEGTNDNLLLKEIVETFSYKLINYYTFLTPKEVVLYGEFFNNDYFITKLRNEILNLGSLDLLKSLKVIPLNEKNVKGGGYLGIKNFFYDTGGKNDNSDNLILGLRKEAFINYG